MGLHPQNVGRVGAAARRVSMDLMPSCVPDYRVVGMSTVNLINRAFV